MYCIIKVFNKHSFFFWLIYLLVLNITCKITTKDIIVAYKEKKKIYLCPKLTYLLISELVRLTTRNMRQTEHRVVPRQETCSVGFRLWVFIFRVSYLYCKKDSLWQVSRNIHLFYSETTICLH